MPSTIEQSSPSQVKLTIEVPFAELRPSLDKAYAQISQQVNIPGFRRGKVPQALIDQRFGRGAVLQEAINEILPKEYSKAVAEHKLSPLTQPEIEVTKLEDGTLVEFTADIVVRPDFELPDPATIEVTVDPVSVDDDTVTETIDALRERLGTTSPVDRPAADGDAVTLDLTATKDGEPIADANATGVTYRIGAGGLVDGLDDAVTGLSAGESADFRSTLVGGPLRGEEADISVTVQQVAERELPAADDEFADSIAGVPTIAELRTQMQARLQAEAEARQAEQARDRLLEAVIAEVDLEVPESVLTAEVDSRHEQLTADLAQAGLTLDAYLEQSEEGRSAEEFWADVDARVADSVKAQLVLDKLADDAEIGVDQNDLTAHILRQAQLNGTTPEAEAQQLGQDGAMAFTMAQIRRTKALGQMLSKAKVADTDGNVIDVAGPQDETED